jgi:malate synthase
LLEKQERVMGLATCENYYAPPHVKKFGYDAPEGVEIRGRYDGEFAKILT